MLPNVQQATIHPILTTPVTAGSWLYTDEYDIYNRTTALPYHIGSVSLSAKN